MCSVQPPWMYRGPCTNPLYVYSSLAEGLCPCKMEKRQQSRVSRAMLEAREVGECRWVRGEILGSPGTFACFRALSTVLTYEGGTAVLCSFTWA